MSFITPMKLEYADHREEIASLNRILLEIQVGARPLPKSLIKTVEYILARLDYLMVAQNARLKVYDQREERA